MPRGYKKNLPKGAVSLKEARGGSSTRRPRKPKQKQRNKYDGSKFLGDERKALYSVHDLFKEKRGAITMEKFVARSSAVRPTVLSGRREPEPSEISQPCVAACCNPSYVIPGLQKLLRSMQQDEQAVSKSSSYRVVAESGLKRRLCEQQKSNVPLDFNDSWQMNRQKEMKKEQARKEALEKQLGYMKNREPVGRYHAVLCWNGTCEYGAYSSYGYDSRTGDSELNVLSNIEEKISNTFKCKSHVQILRKKLNAIFDLKDEIHSFGHFEVGYKASSRDDYSDSIEEITRLGEQCSDAMDDLITKLSEFAVTEKQVVAQTSILACSVYKNHLQSQQHLCHDGSDDWTHLKRIIPPREVAAIPIVVERVRDFLVPPLLENNNDGPKIAFVNMDFVRDSEKRRPPRDDDSLSFSLSSCLAKYNDKSIAYYDYYSRSPISQESYRDHDDYEDDDAWDDDSFGYQ